MEVNSGFQHYEYLKIVDWLDEKDIHWWYFSQNQLAIHMLEQELINAEIEERAHRINKDRISINPNAIDILREDPDLIDFDSLGSNINGFELLNDYIDEYIVDELSWSGITQNPNMIPIIEENLDKVDWEVLSNNPNAMHIVKYNLDRVDWYYLCSNENAIPIIEEELRLADKYDRDSKIDWIGLSENKNAIHILEENIDDVDWDRLVEYNSNADKLLRYNPDMVIPVKIKKDIKERHIKEDGTYESGIWRDADAFTYDLEKIKEERMELNHELHSIFMHPDNIVDDMFSTLHLYG